ATSLTLWGPPDASHPAAPAVPAAVASATAPGAAGSAGDFVERGRWGDTGRAALFSVKAPGALTVSSNGAQVTIDTSDSKSLFLGETPAAFSALLEADVHYRAPALADVNGDGLADLVLRQDNALHVALGTPDGIEPGWSRDEPLPDWLDKPDTELQLRLADLDGDGDTDLLARSKPAKSRLAQVVFTYFVLINDGQRLLPAEAQQVLRLEASGTRAEVTDVDHDGRPDLVLTKWTLPSAQDLVTGFKLQRASYVYFAGQGGGPPFERKPSLRDEQSFTLESLQDALVLRFISGDLSGDGVADLVEMDITGRVAVRRIRREGGLFGGGDWAIEDEAWKRFDMGSAVERLQLQDLNGDGIADLVNPGDRSLHLMLSRRAGAGR
ncbi:MAG TPA: FG-GAP-like repeat-containing protein, partial [Planctomycetota bacterium]|nr:FG-GAP-like repeat-containing protein [Planctomycetota bacterium]